MNTTIRPVGSPATVRHTPPDSATIRGKLQAIAGQYPAALVGLEQADIPRIAFHISLVAGRTGTQISLCDLGGGVGMFSLGCAAVGMRVVLVDDFSDHINREMDGSIFDLHRAHGVEVVCRNVIEAGIDFPANTFDVVTSFDSMEHWHHSPKRLFASVSAALVPGGMFVLGVPNRVNLRKRLSVPLGRGKWSSMEDWYERAEFRGHVREPDVDDLRFIARDMGLERCEIWGRNWIDQPRRGRGMRLALAAADRALRIFPSLCGHIYLVGHKPGAVNGGPSM